MLYVVTGVSGSGKSEYAENLAVQLAGGKPLYYVATMEPYGPEGQARIARHHKLRAGKGFETIECYRNIAQITDRIGEDRMKEATVLLECMSNLLANEMFDETDAANGDLTDKLLSGMSCISRQCKHLIVVTNEVFSDGLLYDEETLEYIRALADINCRMATMAELVTEVVCGIPVNIK